ncbi:hypothetical protein D2M30_1340 [Bacillus amyloliquefaciens]|nr:hypothetical protein D2M30_1340 [Bacillus amyloliquefaciens]
MKTPIYQEYKDAKICYINGTEETSNKLLMVIFRCGYPKFDNCGLFAFFFF